MSDPKPYWKSYQNEPQLRFLVEFLKHPSTSSWVYGLFEFPELTYAQKFAEHLHLAYFNHDLKVSQGRAATRLHITETLKSINRALDGLPVNFRLPFVAIILDQINHHFAARDATHGESFADEFYKDPPYLKDLFALPPLEPLLAHKDHAMLLADTVDQLYECSKDGELGFALQADYIKAIETDLMAVPKRVRQKVAETTATFKEELMMVCWHPDRVMKYIELGIDPEDM